MRLLTILLAATLTGCATSASGDARPSARTLLVAVPPGAGQAERPCSTTKAFFASTVLADREDWYGKHLRVLEKRPLCGAAQEIYRLTWLPTFNPSVVVRVERDAAGYMLTAKRESGAGGYNRMIDVDTSILNAPVHLFVARQLERVERDLEPSEQIEPVPVQIATAAQMVLDGSITHSPSCVTILKAMM